MLRRMVPRTRPLKFGAKPLLERWTLSTNVSPELVQLTYMLITYFL